MEATSRRVPIHRREARRILDDLQQRETDPGLSLLIAQQWDALYGTALHLTRQREAAEDLVQDAIARGLQYRNRFQPGTNLRAWLTQLMKNLWLDQRRRARKHDEHGSEVSVMSLEVALDEHAGHHPDPRLPSYTIEQDIMLRGDIDEALAVIEQLPAYYLDVLRIVVFEDLTYREAAERLGIPKNTAFSAAFRTRAALRAAGLRGLSRPVLD